MKENAYFIELWNLRCMNMPAEQNTIAFRPGILNALFRVTREHCDQLNSTRAIPDPFIDLMTELSVIDDNYKITFAAANGMPQHSIEVAASQLGDKISSGLYRCLKQGNATNAAKCILRGVAMKYFRDNIPYYRAMPITPHDCMMRVY